MRLHWPALGVWCALVHDGTAMASHTDPWTPRRKTVGRCTHPCAHSASTCTHMSTHTCAPCIERSNTAQTGDPIVQHMLLIIACERTNRRQCSVR